MKVCDAAGSCAQRDAVELRRQASSEPLVFSWISGALQAGPQKSSSLAATAFLGNCSTFQTLEVNTPSFSLFTAHHRERIAVDCVRMNGDNYSSRGMYFQHISSRTAAKSTQNRWRPTWLVPQRLSGLSQPHLPSLPLQANTDVLPFTAVFETPR